MYLTLDEYLEYGGQLEDEARFNRHEFRARLYIDLMTLGRIDSEVRQRESLKRCMYELIENYEQEYQQNMSGIGVSSVKNGTVQINYSTTTSATTEMQNRCYGIVAQYLANEVDSYGIPLLYKGVT